MRAAWVLLLPILLFAGCASTQVQTPSGSPEITLSGVRSDQVKPIILNVVINHKLRIKSDTPYSIAVERQTQNIAAGILLSTGYSGMPLERITFMIAEVPGGTRVVADGTFISNAGTAFEKSTPIGLNPPVPTPPH